MDVEVNTLAVFLAAAASMVVGAIWYANSVFGKTWAKLANVDMSKTPKSGEMAWLMGSTFVASLVTAYVLAHVSYLSAQFFGQELLQSALTTAFWLWLGFTAARLYTHDAFEGRRKKLTALNALHELVTFMVMAAVIGAVGL
jgi:hypothetical protein